MGKASPLKNRKDLRVHRLEWRSTEKMVRDGAAALAQEGKGRSIAWLVERKLLPGQVLLVELELAELDRLGYLGPDPCAMADALWRRCDELADGFALFVQPDGHLAWMCRVGGDVMGSYMRPQEPEDVGLLLLQAHMAIGIKRGVFVDGRAK